jgi:signal transduction histidine kinase
MNQNRGFFDGRLFLASSPFRSGHFILTSVIGFGSIALVGFILWWHWQILNLFVKIILAVPIGAQIVYQWLRVRRYYSKIRELYSEISHEEAVAKSNLDEVLKIAVGGMTDILFYCYGMILCSLVVIAALLTHR